MKILITGGTGFTGSHLVERMIKRGHEVIVISTGKTNSKTIEKKGAKLIKGSISDKKTVDKAMKNIDIVFNIAAAFRNINSTKKTYWDTNVKGTKVLLKSAKQNKVKRFIHCSTCGVHGDVKEFPANEDTPMNPGDYYQYTKVQGELAARNFFKKHKLPGVVIRPSGIHGPRDTRLLKLFKLIANNRFIMLGSGKIHYHLCYIDNLIDAFELAMTKKKAIGNVYLIGNKNYLTLNEMTEMIAKICKTKIPKLHIPIAPVWLAGAICEIICTPLKINPPLFRRRVDFFRKNRGFDISKAKKELGYNPKVSNRQGLKKTFDWYKKNKYL